MNKAVTLYTLFVFVTALSPVMVCSPTEASLSPENLVLSLSQSEGVVFAGTGSLDTKGTVASDLCRGRLLKATLTACGVGCWRSVGEHGSRIVKIAISPMQKYAVTVSDEVPVADNGICMPWIVVWSLADGSPVMFIRADPCRVGMLQANPFVTRTRERCGTDEGNASLSCFESGAFPQPLKTAARFASVRPPIVSFSPCDRFLLVCESEYALRIVSLESGESRSIRSPNVVAASFAHSHGVRGAFTTLHSDGHFRRHYVDSSARVRLCENGDDAVTLRHEETITTTGATGVLRKAGMHLTMLSLHEKSLRRLPVLNRNVGLFGQFGTTSLHLSSNARVLAWSNREGVWALDTECGAGPVSIGRAYTAETPLSLSSDGTCIVYGDSLRELKVKYLRVPCCLE